MEVNDLAKYKKAKIVVRDLEQILKILGLSLKGLKPYKKYTSLSETMMALEDSRTILEVHLEHHKRILETKGKVTGD